MLDELNGRPHQGKGMSTAGSLEHPVEFACGVNGEVASQGARRAARPRRVLLWDEALEGEAGVHSPCGSTRGRKPSCGCGEEGIACGGGRVVALQKARWAVKLRRAMLWRKAE